MITNVDDNDIEEVLGLLSQTKHKKKVVGLPTQYDLPGRGRKYCNGCRKYVGVRTTECDCGHLFPVVEKKERDEKAVDSQFNDSPISDEDRRYAIAIGSKDNDYIVYAPSGRCPSILHGVDYDSVSLFCQEVVADGVAAGKVYIPAAIKYFIRNIVSSNSPSYGSMCDFVDQWYAEKIFSVVVENKECENE
jgi:hypothetical protein